MQYFFGVDGGGSTVKICICDEVQNILWEGRGEGVSLSALGYSEAIRRLVYTLTQGTQLLNIHITDFSAGCLGLSGLGRLGDKAAVEREFRAQTSYTKRLVLVSDAEVALIGASKKMQGIILIAGTGSIAMARLSDGQVIRSGGFGHLLGDEGSAYWIAMEALKRSLRAAEGRDLHRTMLDTLMQELAVQDTEALFNFIYKQFDKTKIASLATIVEKFRAEGDQLACVIFECASQELVSLVLQVYNLVQSKLEARPSLILWGGVFDNNEWLKKRVTYLLHTQIPALDIIPARASASFGACILAINSRNKLHS